MNCLSCRLKIKRNHSAAKQKQSSEAERNTNEKTQDNMHELLKAF